MRPDPRPSGPGRRTRRVVPGRSGAVRLVLEQPRHIPEEPDERGDRAEHEHRDRDPGPRLPRAHRAPPSATTSKTRSAGGGTGAGRLPYRCPRANAMADAGSAKRSAYSCQSGNVHSPTRTVQISVPHLSSIVPNAQTSAEKPSATTRPAALEASPAAGLGARGR